MTSISFKIDAPPFSVNSAYYLKSYNKGAPTKIRTQKCRDWGDSILLQMVKIKDKLLKFKEEFDEKEDAISIELVFYIPKDKFYTKKGDISLRSNDLTNVEKLLVDIIFDSRFNNRYVSDTKVLNLDINDKLIVDLSSKKRPTAGDYYIDILILKRTNKFEEIL
jgi:hypothetical protein